MTITRIDPSDIAQWIQENLVSQQDQSEDGVYVSHCIPPIYQSYCKIFHPIYLDLSAPAENSSWNAADECPDMIGDKLISVSTNYGDRGSRVRWKELALKYGLKFHPEINERSLSNAFPSGSFPRSLLGPDEGTLDDTTCDRLIQILLPFTNKLLCYFYYESIATVNRVTPIVYWGQLDEISQCLNYDLLLGARYT